MIQLIRRFFLAVAAVRRGVPLRLAIVLWLLIVTGIAPVDACSICRTETGEKVRQGIFGPDFWWNLSVTAVPFVVVTGIVRLLPAVLVSPRQSPRGATRFQPREVEEPR